MKTCSKCLIEKDVKYFSCIKRNDDGSCRYLNSQCNSCRTISARNKSGRLRKKKGFADDKYKECLNCNNIFEYHFFNKNKRGVKGLSSYCKVCYKLLFKPTKEKSKEHTAKYREKHRERYLAKHRLTQFKRKNLIQAVNDETITDDYLKFVYAQEFCCWCNEKTEVANRTLEHIIELSNGGLHSVHNINMACFSCNSSRLNKENKRTCESLFLKFTEYNIMKGKK